MQESASFSCKILQFVIQSQSGTTEWTVSRRGGPIHQLRTRRFYHRFHAVWVVNITPRFCRERCMNGSIRLSCKLAQKWEAISCKVCWAQTNCICSCRYSTSCPCPVSRRASKATRRDRFRFSSLSCASATEENTFGHNSYFQNLWRCRQRYHAVSEFTFL